MHNYQMMNGHGVDSSWGFVMMLLWAVIIAGIILVIVRFARGHEHRGVSPRGQDAVDIVKERYAKGEIDKEQFEQLKKDLAK
ncbi:MAG: SHOCT domain-containing protein [Candidatus Saccharimonadales bacterium]